MVLSAISCSLSPPIFRIYSLFLLDWKRTVSSKFFDPHIPSLSTEELVLQRHARCVLFRLHRNEHSLLFKLLSLKDWQNRKSFMQCLRTPVSGHLSSHSALSNYGLFAPPALWRLSVSLLFVVETLGSCSAFGAPWSSATLSFLGRGRIATTRK